MEFEIIETSRLLLRKLTPEVYDYIYKHYTDQECMKHLGLRTAQELKVEKEKYRKGLSSYDKSFVIFQLIEKESMQVMGMCGFVRHYPAHFRAEFGYSLDSDTYKQKGYMSEAVAPIIAYGFEKMNLIRIEAMVGSNNEPSIKIVKKLGFEREGLMKQHYYRNGVMEDSIIWALFENKNSIDKLPIKEL